jgi:hypothetical protein
MQHPGFASELKFKLTTDSANHVREWARRELVPDPYAVDIDGDGYRDWIAWTDPEAEDGLLVWDRNLNGIIDSGRELFGDSTTQPPSNEPNGFLALAVLDQAESGGNGDGVISSLDSGDELANRLTSATYSAFLRSISSRTPIASELPSRVSGSRARIWDISTSSRRSSPLLCGPRRIVSITRNPG